MSWSDKFQKLDKRHPESTERSTRIKTVQGLSDIPTDATPRQAFRLKVEVCKVTEQVTRNGDPCFFLDVRDADGLRFPIIVWDWQMARFQGAVAEGQTITLDVRVPKDGYQAFNLA